jgi:hypothetical protein
MFSKLWQSVAAILGVLAVALLIAALYFRGTAAVSDARAHKAEQEADQARAEVDALKEARLRDVKAFIAASAARQAVDQQTAESDQRAAQIEVKYRDRIVEVPAVCPGPDADLLRDQQAQAERLSAAESRLRGVRRAAEEAAE